MRVWLVISGIFVLLAGLSIGVLVGKATRPGEGNGDIPLIDLYPEAPLYLVTSEEIYKELQLKDEQRERIDSLLADYYKRVRELRSAMGELAFELRAGIKAELTADQQERLSEIQRRYGEREIHVSVTRDLARWRLELELKPEQEPRVYQILFDATRRKKEIWRKGKKEGWDFIRAEMAKIRSQQDALLAEVLSASQFEIYKKVKERERTWRLKHEKRHEKKQDGDKKAQEARENGQDSAKRSPSRASP